MPRTKAFTFDRRAADFDRRSGLPADALPHIAAAVGQIAAAAHCDGIVLDLGAGTGELGLPIGRLVRRYVGLDLSLPMLDVFRRRAPGVQLVRADADRRWPLRAGTVRLIFASRAAHLLQLRPLCEEVQRVLTSDGRLVIGGVRRAPDSVRATLRRRLHELLAEQGIMGRRRGEAWRQLRQLFEDRGFQTSLQTVAEWQAVHRPADSLDAWRGKDGLAGRPVDKLVQRQVLASLERFAIDRFEDLNRPRTSTEHYELMVVRPREL